MDKKEWRRLMKQKLHQLQDEERRKIYEEIHKKLFSSTLWRDAETIGITVSRDFELPTKPVIEKAWQEGKTVAVPRCQKDSKTMEFRVITSFSDLENEYMDLFEPIVKKTDVLIGDQIHLMFVPGLVFSLKGFRIGYGGGYYDRYLANYQNPTLSLAFSFQITADVPSEPFDIPVDFLLSEDGLVKV
ncbi:5-formyltetrahydrofolate cyclo-ligase [Fictibacillus iocasae]|uniref:5-formyltetrahydrofolate cyclo-ligase n=1 Tax=Fictibacillus iocasae TaxID=2715437 RepID=A0ABW2NNZ7_9BACL